METRVRGSSTFDIARKEYKLIERRRQVMNVVQMSDI
jgi:hypothetical protein